MKYIGVDWKAINTQLPINPGDFVLFCDLRDCRLDGLDLSEVEFLGCRLNGATFRGTKMDKTRLIECFASERGEPTDFRTASWQEVLIIDSHLHCLSDRNELSLKSWSNDLEEAAWNTLARTQGIIHEGIEKIAQLDRAVVAPLLACLLSKQEWEWWDTRQKVLETLGYLRQTNPPLLQFPQRDCLLMQWMFQFLGDEHSLVRRAARDLVDKLNPSERILKSSIHRMMMGQTKEEKLVGLQAIQELVDDDVTRNIRYSRLIDLNRLKSFLNDPDDEIRRVTEGILEDYNLARQNIQQKAARLWKQIQHSEKLEEIQPNPIEIQSSQILANTPQQIDVFSSANFKKHPDRAFEIEGEIDKLQRRPQHGQIVINHHQQGIKIFDLWQQAIVKQIDFSEIDSACGLIDGWCFSADGKAGLILNQPSRKAVWFSLETQEPNFLEGPSWTGDYKNFCYIWENNSLWLTGGDVHVDFNLQWQDARPELVRKSGVYARKAHRDWRNTVGDVNFGRFGKSKVLKVEPDDRQTIFYTCAESLETVEVINWSTNTTKSFLVPEYVSTVALSHETLYLMYEHEVHAINSQGQIKTVYCALPGYSFTSMDTLPVSENLPASLVLACTSWNEPKHSQIFMWQLDDE